jgi:hypothetical protein
VNCSTECGGVNAIASAMEAHPSDETICEIACIALRSLGTAQQAIPLIVSRNALKQVVEALARFPSASDVSSAMSVICQHCLFIAVFSWALNGSWSSLVCKLF